MPQITRIFFDWSQPALRVAADWLARQAEAGGDLSQLVVVVPGGRAGRRLLEILVTDAAARGVGLSPPTIVTMGGLPELLYSPQKPFADELTQRLAWVAALRRVPRDVLTPYIPALAQQQEASRLLELADVLRSQHVELAADGHDFEDVAKQTAAMGEQTEAARWKALRRVQRTYLDILDELQVWDKQTARLYAIKFQECATDKQIVLLATVDMNRAARQMLDQVAANVTALIFAPEPLHDRFDEHGCVIGPAWSDVRVPLDDARIALADDPVDQADMVARTIAAFDEKYRAAEITVGVCDERVVPQIERQLRQCAVPARFGPGRPLSASPPYRLLAALADFLERRSWRDLAALLRHPDLEMWLAAQPGVAGDWLTFVDTYQTTHVPAQLDDAWLGDAEDYASVKAAFEAVAHLTKPLLEVKRSVREWTAELTNVLKAIYADRKIDPTSAADRALRESLQHIHAALVAQQYVPQPIAPSVTSADALRWALDAVAGQQLAPPADADAVELLGWLELPLDDAPALIVTTLNEGHVPKSSTSDLFLPDSLRKALGLDDNIRRYARDAYALSVLAASRDLQIIVGRRDADGYPLAPSRLLFACDDATLVARAQRFFSPARPTRSKRPLAGALTATREKFTFTQPLPEPLKSPLTKLRVTAFRDYLACPYRFYLKNVARIEAISDEAEELGGDGFGTLAHEVLNQFGLDERRHTSSAEEIDALLTEILQQAVRENFGTQLRPAVAIQVEQLRRRLERFAQEQAARAANGWRIVHTELDIVEGQCTISIDGQPFHLTGRIDRIDQHEATGAWAIWDYKTSDTAKKPTATHQRKAEWIDLQLPLYRQLAAAVETKLQSILQVDGKLQLGYVQLPKSVDGVKFEIAEWSTADLDAAYERACDVIRAIRQGVFWPPNYPPPDFSEAFAGLCLDNVFGRPDCE